MLKYFSLSKYAWSGVVLMAFDEPLQSRRVGEVIESDTYSVVAQCYELYMAPPIGSVITIGTPPVYAIVKLIKTEPLDPSRPILARGENAQTESQVYEDNPQIPRLLTTRFEGLLIGYQEDEIDRAYLPPVPPIIHSFIYTCDTEATKRITSELAFLRSMVSQVSQVSDEVIAAFVRNAGQYQESPNEYLVAAGRVLAEELSGDFPRLNSILRRVTL